MTTQSSDESINRQLGVFLGAMAVLAAYSCYVGLMAWTLWGWFVVPFGLPQVTLAWAIGLCVTANLIVNPVPRLKPAAPGPEMPNKSALTRPVALLAIGYVAKQFM